MKRFAAKRPLADVKSNAKISFLSLLGETLFLNTKIPSKLALSSSNFSHGCGFNNGDIFVKINEPGSLAPSTENDQRLP